MYIRTQRALAVGVSAQDGYWKIVSKKRYINPLVSEKRILDICEDLQESIQLYLNNDFDYYVKAIREDK